VLMATAVAATAAAAGGSNVEFIRARSDKREYRRVVLANALEILLISDPDTDKVRLRLRLRLRPPPFACSPIAAPRQRGMRVGRTKAYGPSICLRD
jgi:hypothetical protein